MCFYVQSLSSTNCLSDSLENIVLSVPMKSSGNRWSFLLTEKKVKITYIGTVAYRGILFGGRVQQIQMRTGVRGNGNLGAVAPYSRILEAAIIWYKKFHFI